MFPVDLTFLFLVGTVALLPIALLMAESVWPADRDSNSS